MYLQYMYCNERGWCYLPFTVPPKYRKALIFCGLYISQISRISLHSRNLFSAKIIFPVYLHNSYASTQNSTVQELQESSQCTPNSKRFSLRSYATGSHNLIHSANCEMSGLVRQDRRQNSTIINTTRGRYAGFSATKSLSSSIMS